MTVSTRHWGYRSLQLWQWLPLSRIQFQQQGDAGLSDHERLPRVHPQTTYAMSVKVCGCNEEQLRASHRKSLRFHPKAFVSTVCSCPRR